MKSITKKSSMPIAIAFSMICFLLGVFGAMIVSSYVTNAASPKLSIGQRLITIHDSGHDKGIITHATTLRYAFEESGIQIDPNDNVEPGLDEELIANNYEVNIYRARPVTIVDGNVRQKVMSPYQTAKQIAKQANITLHDEDITTITASTNMVSQGSGVQMVVDRATPFTLVLYGTKNTAYTQKATVADVLKEKNITIGSNDTLSVSKDATIVSGMTIELWRNGKQTVTEKQDINFEVEQIQDANHEVGYKKVTTSGIKGKKTVTYEIVMKNGKEESRREIQSVVIEKPQKQVEIVGSKPSFSGDFAAALAKLRSCEGGYNSWNAAGPYYGAYQFNQGTWNSVSSAPYGNATPAEQDAAAHALYMRSGWTPWPSCGAGLPDTYR